MESSAPLLVRDTQRMDAGIIVREIANHTPSLSDKKCRRVFEYDKLRLVHHTGGEWETNEIYYDGVPVYIDVRKNDKDFSPDIKKYRRGPWESQLLDRFCRESFREVEM